MCRHAHSLFIARQYRTRGIDSGILFFFHIFIYFTARAIRKCGLCCRPVFVCPSVTLVDCIQMADYIVKLLSRPGSPSF